MTGGKGTFVGANGGGGGEVPVVCEHCPAGGGRLWDSPGPETRSRDGADHSTPTLSGNPLQA